jgi:hypothetical protein
VKENEEDENYVDNGTTETMAKHTGLKKKKYEHVVEKHNKHSSARPLDMCVGLSMHILRHARMIPLSPTPQHPTNLHGPID